MGDKNDVIVLRIDRKAGVLLGGVLLTAVCGVAVSEHLSLSTTYPAPVGVYNQVVTTGDAGLAPSDTTLNRNAGNTILTPPPNALGRVGIGTAVPASKLSVAGGIQVGADAGGCNAQKAGTMRWEAGALQVCDGSAWSGAGGGIAGPLVYQCPANPGNIGGGAWGFYGCQSQITTQSYCYTIEYPNSQSYPCTPIGNLLYR